MPHPGKSISLKTRWMIWRARYSTPALLTRFEERKVVSAITALNGGMAILAIGVFAWLTDLPLAFPALGPTAFILFASPRSPAAAPRSVILGHYCCLTCGFVVWHLVSAAAGQPVSTQTSSWLPYLSASIGLAASCALLVWLSCPHPPACASCLVFALGGVTDWLSVLLMAVAIAWITVQAVAMNRIAGVVVPTWSPAALPTADSDPSISAGPID